MNERKKFYTFVGSFNNEIVHRFYDDEGKEVIEVVPEYDYTLYTLDNKNKGKSEFTTFKNENLVEFKFNTIREMNDFYRENKDLYDIYGQTSAVHQFIAKEYNYDVKQTKPLKILNFDIETDHAEGITKYSNYHIIELEDGTKTTLLQMRLIKNNTNLVWCENKLEYTPFNESCFGNKNIGFPDVEKADSEILSISLKEFGDNKIFYTFGTKPLHEYDNPNGKYIKCKDEKELLVKFMAKWKDINPHIVTGWNCVPLTNNVWLDNKIVKMGDIVVKSKLYNSFVEHVYPTTNKKMFETRLVNGTITKSSKEHIYPIGYIKKGGYITNNNTLIHSDETVEAIDRLSKENYIYYKLNLGDNKNEDLTYRNLIKNNYSKFKELGVIFKVCDTIIVRKISHILGYATREKTKSINFWNDENIINLTSEKEFNEYLDRNDSIVVFHRYLNNTRNSIKIDLNDVVSYDVLWFLGMWFTDGTSTYKTDVTICNKNEDVNNKLFDISKNIFMSNQSKPKPSQRDGCTYTNFGLSKTWFLKLFIYDGVLAKSKKKLDVTLLSQLSKNQFMAFYAGCIDGDGGIYGGATNLFNYDGELNSFSELLLWNGIFNTISKNSIRSYINDDFFKNCLVVEHKRNSIDLNLDYQRHSKSNNIKWFFCEIDKCYYVRLDSITETDDYVDMIDISTDTHYFINNGIETHNCDGFDIPFLINRIGNVLGKKYMAYLSPFYNKLTKRNDMLIRKREFGSTYTYNILGVVVYDYIELYKKYNMDKKESYKLDFIGEIDIGQRKVNFDEYDKSLVKLYEGTVRVDFTSKYSELNDVLKYARIRHYTINRLKEVGYDILSNGIESFKDMAHSDANLNLLTNCDDEYHNILTEIETNLCNDSLKALFLHCDERVRTLSYKKFVDYNEQDANLVELLDNKWLYMTLALRVAHMTKSRLNEVFGSTAAWDNMIYSRMLTKNKQIPPKKENHKSEKFAGAFVKEPRIGSHKYVAVFDLKSLYPSLIRMFNMSPETFIKYRDDGDKEETINKFLDFSYDCSEAKSKGYATTPIGCIFHQDFEGVIPETMRYLMDGRDEVKNEMKDKKREFEKYKREAEENNIESSIVELESHKLDDVIQMLDSTQLALKILANSGYGVLGTETFRYYELDLAESITSAGKVAILYMMDCVNKYLEDICKTKDVEFSIYGDTDSIFVQFENWVNMNEFDKLEINDCITEMDNFIKSSIEPFIQKKYEELSDYVGAKENLLIMKREALSDAFIIRGKKNYIMQVYDNEGVRFNTPILKLTGVESQKSSTPKIIREKLIECYRMCLNTNKYTALNLKKVVDDFRNEFMEIDVESIAKPSGINDIEKWVDKRGNIISGCPIHVRAAIVYNEAISQDKDLSSKYERIMSGDKIKYLKLKLPNILRSHVVAFKEDLPYEFELDDYIDRKNQFDDSFVSPLESFTKLIGWDIRRTRNVTNLFGEEEDNVQEYIEPKIENVDSKKRSRGLNSLFGEVDDIDEVVQKPKQKTKRNNNFNKKSLLDLM